MRSKIFLAIFCVILIGIAGNAFAYDYFYNYLDTPADTLTSTTTYLPTTAGTATYVNVGALYIQYHNIGLTIEADSLSDSAQVYCYARDAGSTNWYRVGFYHCDNSNDKTFTTRLNIAAEETYVDCWTDRPYDYVKWRIDHTAGDILAEFGFLWNPIIESIDRRR